MTDEDHGYVIRTGAGAVDFERVHGWLAKESYWAAGRPEDQMRRAIEGSESYSVFAGDVQVAYARVVTDGATFAWLCDVFVDAAHRGVGLGQRLVRSIVDDLTRRGVPRMVLATLDAHEVYRRVGFTELEWPARWMEIDRRPTKAAIAARAPRS